MAIGIHVVHTRFIGVDPIGNVVDKNVSSTTLKQVLSSSHEHRVIPDAAIASSAGNPTIKEYLEAEAAANYILGYISQNMIVTYDAGNLNSAS